MTKWGTPVEKWKHNQTPNTTHSLKVGRLFNINENSSLVPVKVNTDTTSPDYILLPCFKSTKPGFTGKSFFICAPVRCFGDELGEQLWVRPYLPTSVPGLTNALVAEREQIPAAGLQNPVERLKKKKLETSDFSRKCSIITSRCCVQVSTASCQNGINVPTHDDLFVSCYISNTLKVTFIPVNVKSLLKKKKKKKCP